MKRPSPLWSRIHRDPRDPRLIDLLIEASCGINPDSSPPTWQATAEHRQAVHGLPVYQALCPDKPPLPPRIRTPTADIETNLVDAAEVVLLRDGLDAITVRAVAAEAVVAPMGIYNHLGGKDGPDRRPAHPRLRRTAHRRRGLSRDRPAGTAARLRHVLPRVCPGQTAVLCGDVPRRAATHARVPRCGQARRHSLRRAGNPRATAMGAGRILSSDPLEVAQQIWASVHGAVSLELGGLVLTLGQGLPTTPSSTTYSVACTSNNVQRPHRPLQLAGPVATRANAS